MILFDNLQDKDSILAFPGLGDDLPHQPFADPLSSPLRHYPHGRHPAGPAAPGHQGHPHRLAGLQHDLAGNQINMILPEQIIHHSGAEFDFDQVTSET